MFLTTRKIGNAFEALNYSVKKSVFLHFQLFFGYETVFQRAICSSDYQILFFFASRQSVGINRVLRCLGM